MSAPEPDEPVLLPLGRVRAVMKSAPHVRAVTQEASFVVTKAAELFLGALAAHALAFKTGDGKLSFLDLGALVAAPRGAAAD